MGVVFGIVDAQMQRAAQVCVLADPQGVAAQQVAVKFQRVAVAVQRPLAERGTAVGQPTVERTLAIAGGRGGDSVRVKYGDGPPAPRQRRGCGASRESGADHNGAARFGGGPGLPGGQMPGASLRKACPGAGLQKRPGPHRPGGCPRPRPCQPTDMGGSCGLSTCIFSVGAITSAVPVATVLPAWFSALHSRVTNFLSSRLSVTSSSMVISSPIFTGSRNRRVWPR